MTATAFELLAQLAPTLPEASRLRGEKQPDNVAYVFLRDGETPEQTLTYGQLDTAARAGAAALDAAGLSGGAAVLLYPSGLEFISTLLACMYAGIAGAPVQVPTRRRSMHRVRRIADDVGTSTILTTAAVKRELEEGFGDLPELAGLTLLDTESMQDFPTDDWAGSPPGPDDIALLQYTSGSTGDPKGVEVTHANFRSNVAETIELWPLRSDGTVVNWLPLFHDMGLMFGVVMPLWSGIPAYLMAPQAFIRRPARWLEAISRFRGTHAAAPSFAYELCVRSATDAGLPPGLDLSSWRVAVNGAEAVRWATVRAFTEAYAPAGFRPQAMCPGYGLAENTLKLSGSPEDREPTVLRLDAEALQEGRVAPLAGPELGGVPVVGCGVTVGTSHLSIVDPATGIAQQADQVGEIWINGPCVARGYHGRPADSAEAFGARIVGQEQRGTWLRTGDLGFLHGDEVFIAGRLKDLVIHQGRNYYPQDIELSAEKSDPALHPNCAAAFAVDDGHTERVVLLVEADGRALRNGGGDSLRARVRDAVRDGQRLWIDEIVLVRRGSLPKTSSGKMQRREARRRYLDGEFGPAPAREA
ncbi:fatty acyl-AMP ligase [Streptantibioticus ferralitis]|uniref:Fatty acyl-AMP ligase n=1 Tax=Streptantibioticus ferralitis TaxID=236510 RepID=A0ABT5ZC41_9ACTN|nr:fatty acyl-AMP ligase [Streptantibioticus ferralitis]MDF2261415.1 fatty acyl-AMP ligase [Streptantibioticus ferralitis]